jgi:hypothetical protein
LVAKDLRIVWDTTISDFAILAISLIFLLNAWLQTTMVNGKFLLPHSWGITCQNLNSFIENLYFGANCVVLNGNWKNAKTRRMTYKIALRIFGFIFIGFAALGLLLSFTYLFDWGWVKYDYKVFGWGSDGGASTTPIMYGLCSIAGSILLRFSNTN